MQVSATRFAADIDEPKLAFVPATSFAASCRPVETPQTKGWAMKAHEFSNTGPPALLNNPQCSRRVVCFPFHKHALEVHYG
jgi:hypothetical protein